MTIFGISPQGLETMAWGLGFAAFMLAWELLRRRFWGRTRKPDMHAAE